MTGTVNGCGVWTVVVTGVTDGVYTWTGTVTDGVGNECRVASVTFTVDTAAPVAPVISVPATGDHVATGNVTVSGTGEAGGTISIYSGGVVVVTGTVNASGTWTVIVP